jgi:anti-anti-sigma regulatory factor
MEVPGVSQFDEEGRTIVKIVGSAQVETAMLLQQNLAQTQINRAVAIDCGVPEHVAGSVLKVLLALRKLLADRGCPS